MTLRHHSKQYQRYTVLVAIVLLVSGCSSRTPPARPDLKGPLLSGTNWTATLIENDFAVGRRPTIQFREDGKAAGTTGCTVYFGSVETAGNALRIRNLQLEPETARRDTCDSLHRAQQARFVAALESARSIRVQSGKMMLVDARQNLRVLLERRQEPQASEARMVDEVGGIDFPASARPANDPLSGIGLAAVTPAPGEYSPAQVGVLVARAPTDNPFDLREGDVIRSVNARLPANAPHALRILRSYPPGTTLDLQVLRQGELLNLRVTLTE